MSYCAGPAAALPVGYSALHAKDASQSGNRKCADVSSCRFYMKVSLETDIVQMFSCEVTGTYATYCFVHDITDTDWQAQNGSSHGFFQAHNDSTYDCV